MPFHSFSPGCYARSNGLPFRPNTLPSWGKFSIILALHQLLSIPFPAHQNHHRPLILLISLCLIRSLLQERQLSHHFHNITPPHLGGTTSSLFFNHFYHIEDNVQLGWEESWGIKFLLLMRSYFGNLVAFCLILKFLKVFILPSMLIKEKFSNWNRRNWIFVFSLDLEFVLCLLKLMNYWNFYWMQP